MKKNYLIATILLAAAISILPLGAFASTLSFSPSNINIIKGRTVDVTVTVDPQGTAAYTSSATVNFPANLISVSSFEFAPGWMPLAQTGYDLTDNPNGIVIKTAGYPGGLSNTAVLGTIHFLAKASGNGVIKTTSNSFVYDINSQNTLTGAPQINLAVSNPVVPSTAPKVTTPVQEPVATEPAPVLEPEPVVVQSTNEPQPASVSSAFSRFTPYNIILGVIIALAIILVLYGLWTQMSKVSKRKETN